MENIMTRKTHPVIRDSFNMRADELALLKPSNDTRPLESFSRAASGDLLERQADRIR